MHSNCFFCHLKTLEKQIEKFEPSETVRQNMIAAFVQRFGELQGKNNPEVARELHAIIRNHIGETDPYSKEKAEGNRKALELLPQWTARIKKASNPVFEAFKLALAANIIDFGPNHQFDIEQDIERLYNQELAVNDFQALNKRLKTARRVFYIGDNAGEIVFDKFLLEQIDVPEKYFGVRGAPIINDALLSDANETGIDKIATIISNGNDAPSTLLHLCTDDFNAVFNTSDLIIAKGMGNFEGLMNMNDERLFFALVVKCQAIGDLLGQKKGDTVLINSTKVKSITAKSF
ncbi:MAG: ARMT1-like domain-containing protein [Salinivirgaceae bacterium]